MAPIEQENRPPRAPRPEDCLAGGGEMGAIMRQLDWSRTPVGPVPAWPQSLRTAISMMLQSRFGNYIAWGPDFTQFYNDAYRPILGSTKHPAFGKPARETFQESWHIIGPLFEEVMRGNAIGSDDWMLPLDRHGYLEECYFIFSYSPIQDESNGVGGVLVTVTESTGRVLGERRLRTLRDLAASAGEVKTPGQAWEGTLQPLRENPSDLPFTLLYELEPDARAARLVGSTALPPGHPAAPERVDFGQARPGWPLEEVARTGEVRLVSDLRQRFGELPGAPWPESPHSAVVLPITRPGLSHPYGILVAGVSPRRALDDAYREFYTLVANPIATSVSNARAYEEERRRAEALATLDRAKTDFFSNVSHEFRTPLTLMLGPLEELLTGTTGVPLAEAQRKQVEAAHRNALRLLKLVNTMLDFARIEAGRAQASFEPTDLAHLTTELASVFRSTLETAGLRFRLDCPPLPQALYVDRDLWEKIVLNLLSNAFKFTFEGEISVALRWTGEGAELEVRDTGTGIPPEELPRLFERFHRVRGAQSRSHEGTGIGLALVQELVRMHGGSLAVESEPGRGTTFRISIKAGTGHLPKEHLGPPRLPSKTAPQATLYLEEARHWLPPTPPAATAARDPRRILVVDDNEDLRSYLQRLLAQQWNVETVPDGALALEAARRSPPDLIIADVMMPHLDGFGLVRTLRADPRLPYIPVILLSARAGEEARIEGLDAGADDYLVKPFSARELVARASSQLALARARAAEETWRSELYDLFMQAPAPICVLRGPELTFEMANALYRKLLGRPDLVGKPLLEAMPEVRGQGFDELLRDVMRTGAPYIGQEMLFRVDLKGEGNLSETYWTFIYAPLRNASGAIDRVMAFCNEVTEQVRARKGLQLLNDRLQLAIEASELGTWSWDPATRRGESSERTQALFGVPTDRPATSDQLFPRIHPEDRQRVEELVERALEPGAQAFRTEFRLAEGVSGRERWLRSVARPFGGRLIGIVADISELKRAKHEAHLRETIANNASLALFMTDAHQHCTYMNAAAERLTGFTLAEVQGRPLHDFVHHTRPDGRPYLISECPVHAALPTRSQVRGEEFFVHRDGHFYPVAFGASPIIENDQLIGTVLEVRDLTQEKSHERERADLFRREQEARRAAEAASRAKDEFLALLGHELRNPLAPILTAMDLMKIKGPGSFEAERGIIERQLRHMVQLVDDLLDVSRITRGKIQLRPELMEISAAISRAAEMASPLLEQRAHRLDIAVPREGLKVRGDAFRLAQVFANLLTNAAKYTPPGGQISIHAAARSGKIVVSVRDNGEGIEPGMLERIFDWFVQANRPTHTVAGGLGLGLPLVRALLSLHEGTITAYSLGRGSGSEFTVELPAAPPTASTEPDAAPLRPAPPKPRMSRRLLLVDDNQDAVETMAEALQLTGFEVAVANDGPTALGLVTTFKPDTAILDIGLPVMDGYELGRKLRELLGPELRLIAVTGYGQERDRERTWQEGFTAHLVKPVDFDALDRVLSGVDDPLARREGGPGSTPMRTARPGAPDAGA